MTRTDGPIPGAESAAQPPESPAPHVSADPVDRLLGRLLGAPLWPSVFAEDLESMCEYGPHPYHPDTRSDCLLFDALGPIPGEPDYDENYHDQQKDEAA